MNEANKKQADSVCCTGPSRASVKSFLERKIIDLGREIAVLQMFIDCIPWKILTSEDEEQLWNYFARKH